MTDYEQLCDLLGTNDFTIIESYNEFPSLITDITPETWHILTGQPWEFPDDFINIEIYRNSDNLLYIIGASEETDDNVIELPIKNWYQSLLSTLMENEYIRQMYEGKDDELNYLYE